MSRRSWFVALAATPTLVSGVLVAASTTARAAAATCSRTSQGDLDGNGRADLIVSTPNSQVVDIHYDAGTSKVQRLTQAQFNPSDQLQFGTSTSVATDPGRCNVLVIGAPGSIADDTPGKVYLAPVVNGRVSPTAARTLVAEPAAGSRDRFGTAVAAYGQDIWVGAPGADVNGAERAGAVFHYRLTSSGTARLIGRYTEATPGVPGGPELGDNFGSVLSMDDAGAVAIGEPGEDVGGQRDAGTVTVIRTDASRFDPGTGAFVSATTISQNTPGVGGAAEALDGFGTSLSMIETGYPDTSLPDLLAVGTPGEGIGSASRTGTVQLFELQPGYLRQTAGYTQNTAGVPGSNESGDGFGRSVQFGSFTGGLVDGIRALDLAIGVPYEDRGTGRVVVRHGVQGYPWSIAPVTAPAGSHTGRSLSPVALPGSGGSRLAVARPYDNHGNDAKYQGAGSVAVLDDHAPAKSVALSDSAGAQKFGYYGIPANLIATQTITVR